MSRNVTEGGGGLREALCNTKVYMLLTLYIDGSRAVYSISPNSSFPQISK